MSPPDNERGPGGGPDLDSTIDPTAHTSDQSERTATVTGLTASGQVIADYRHAFGANQAARLARDAAQTTGQSRVRTDDEAPFDPDEDERLHDEVVARNDGKVVGVFQRRTSWTAAELLSYEFPALTWAVRDLLAAGLTILAGPPKVAKSWWALNIAVAVAAGGKALGRIHVDAGAVLYLALEDTGRRMQDRLRKVLGDSPAPGGLMLAMECERMPDGADRIRAWLTEHPDARLVVVDVFARVRARADPRMGLYEADYAAASTLKSIADEFGIALLVVHHTRKGAADDFLDSVSGSQGLAGCADAVLVLSRARNTAQAVLKVTGRDIEEAQYALEFSADIGAWQMLDGPATDYELGETRRRILEYVRRARGRNPDAHRGRDGHQVEHGEGERPANGRRPATRHGRQRSLPRTCNPRNRRNPRVTRVTAVTAPRTALARCGSKDSTDDRSERWILRFVTASAMRDESRSRPCTLRRSRPWPS